MGVCFVSYAVSDSNIEELLADPLLVWRVVESEDESFYLRVLNEAAKTSLLGRIFGKSKPAPAARDLEFTHNELRSVDLDKSWDGLNACLRVCAASAPNFFEGTGKIGKVEVGYGAALYHRSEAMRRIADAYARVTEEQLLATFRSLDLKRTYPSSLWKGSNSAVEAYLSENFVELQAFVSYAREHSLGAVIQFT